MLELKYILLWLGSVLFSIGFCYYTSDKSYYIRIGGENREEFLERLGRENMSKGVRRREVLLIILIPYIFGILATEPLIQSMDIEKAVTLGVCIATYLTVCLSVMGVVGIIQLPPKDHI